MDAKARAEKLITIFISQCVSGDADAGWHNPSQVELLQQDASRIGGRSAKVLSATGVDSSGGCKDPDVKMLSEVRYLRDPHANFELAKFYLCEIHRKKPEYYFALIAIPWYSAVYKQKYTQEKAARACGVTIDSYKSALKNGYEKLVDMIEYDWRRERSVA